MIKNIIPFIIDSFGNYVPIYKPNIKARTTHTGVIQVIAPFDPKINIAVTYRTKHVKQQSFTEYMIITDLKGKDVLDPNINNYQHMVDWNVWEVTISEAPLNLITSNRNTKVSVSFSMIDIVNLEELPHRVEFGANRIDITDTPIADTVYVNTRPNFYSNNIGRRLYEGESFKASNDPGKVYENVTIGNIIMNSDEYDLTIEPTFLGDVSIGVVPEGTDINNALDNIYGRMDDLEHYVDNLEITGGGTVGQANKDSEGNVIHQTYVKKKYPEITGDLNANMNKLRNVGSGILSTDVPNISQVDGWISSHNTSGSAHNDIRNLISALQGAIIYRGKINKNTEEVNNAKLNSRLYELMNRNPILGDALVDNNSTEWYYNGEEWNELGSFIAGLATENNDGLLTKEHYVKLRDLYNKGTLDLMFSNYYNKSQVDGLLQTMKTIYGVETTELGIYDFTDNNLKIFAGSELDPYDLLVLNYMPEREPDPMDPYGLGLSVVESRVWSIDKLKAEQVRMELADSGLIRIYYVDRDDEFKIGVYGIGQNDKVQLLGLRSRELTVDKIVYDQDMNLQEKIEQLETLLPEGVTLPSISINDTTATTGKYISRVQVDPNNDHRLIITKANLPAGGGDPNIDLSDYVMFEDIEDIVSGVSYNSSNHKITFSRYNNTDVVIDLPIESLIKGISLVQIEGVDHLKLTFEDDTFQTVSLNVLLTGVATEDYVDTEIGKISIPTIPDITLSDDLESAGKYISRLQVDPLNKHRLIVTKRDLPEGTGGSGAGDFSGDYLDLINTPTKLSDFINDQGFINSHQSIKTLHNKTLTGTGNVTLSATDVGALSINHDASGVTTTKISNWDTAYGWGNHANAGYLTSHQTLKTILNKTITGTGNVDITASDVGALADNHPASGVTSLRIANWDNAYGWGDHSTEGYQKSSDVTSAINLALSSVLRYKGSVASYANLPTSGQSLGDFYNVTDTGINYAWDGTGWDQVGGLADLSGLVPNTRKINSKELSSDITLSATDVGALADNHPASGVTTAKISNWDTSFGWGNHANAGYLTSHQDIKTILNKTITGTGNVDITASDVGALPSNHPASGVTTTKISNWDTAYGWGNHSTEGYLKEGDLEGIDLGVNLDNYYDKLEIDTMVGGIDLILASILDDDIEEVYEDQLEGVLGV